MVIQHLVLLRDGRKIFRIGKGLNELQWLIKTLSSKEFKPTLPALLEVASKISYFFYWLFDNTSILAAIKLINLDKTRQTKIAMLGWFLGTLFSLLKLIQELSVLLSKKSKEEGKSNTKKIFNTYLNIISKIGDLLPSAQGIELPHRILGRGFSEVSVGCGGFIAGLIALYNAWTAK